MNYHYIKVYISTYNSKRVTWTCEFDYSDDDILINFRIKLDQEQESIDFNLNDYPIKSDHDEIYIHYEKDISVHNIGELFIELINNKQPINTDYTSHAYTYKLSEIKQLTFKMQS